MLGASVASPGGRPVLPQAFDELVSSVRSVVGHYSLTPDDAKYIAYATDEVALHAMEALRFSIPSTN
jgi:hypothetical protein